MFRKTCLATCVFLILHLSVEGAMKKSWKSAANFDEEIPKLSPFENEGDLMNKDEADLNEVLMKTTLAPTSPSPSAETLATKISSKIKAPSKYIADIYNQLSQNMIPVQVGDFGAFNANMPTVEPTIEQESVQQVLSSVTNEQIDIEQILNDLSDEGDKKSESINNSFDADDELEISTITNVDTNTTQYKVGPLMNLTIDSEDEMVNVNLDQNTLKEIFTGRGKKYNMIERVVPLFILPFLIQSAVIPFMVTMIKLFLLKSLFAGKIAVMLLLLGALKSHQNGLYMKSMQHSPYYMKDFPQSYPERRLETNFDGGYKVEGKPESFVN